MKYTQKAALFALLLICLQSSVLGFPGFPTFRDDFKQFAARSGDEDWFAASQESPLAIRVVRAVLPDTVPVTNDESSDAFIPVTNEESAAFVPPTTEESSEVVPAASEESPEVSDESPEASPEAESQVDDVQEPVAQTPVKQEPVKQEPVKQEPVKQEPVKQAPVKEVPVKQPIKAVVQEPVKQEQVKTVQQSTKQVVEVSNERIEEERVVEHSSCSASTGCVRVKPDYSKAVAIALKGNALAAVVTAKVAAPAVLVSAKTAALASLIPIKMAAGGALVGTLIAKPIVIASAINGAIAAKLSYLLVGKPIAIGADVLAGAEALRAKLSAKKAGCVSSTCD